jgi:Pretoxin HINT domain
VKIIIGNDTILATPTHKFFTPLGWIQAKYLTTKISIQSSSGSYEKINSIFAFDSIATVYNFEVEDNHNYFITQRKLLVHNGGCEKLWGKFGTLGFGIKNSQDLAGEFNYIEESNTLVAVIRNIAKQSGTTGLFDEITKAVDEVAKSNKFKDFIIRFIDVDTKIVHPTSGMTTLELYTLRAKELGYNQKIVGENGIGGVILEWSK